MEPQKNIILFAGMGASDSETKSGSSSGSSSHVLVCPVFNSYNTELMPIATDESFRIEYNPT